MRNVTVDTAIQNMLLDASDHDIEQLATLAKNKRTQTINCYKIALNWTEEQCGEFLDNVVLAHKLLIQEKAA